MITPTIGRVLHFWANGANFPDVCQRDQPLDAHVTYVWSDHMVNVAGFDANGDPFKATSVLLVQGGEKPPAIGSRQCYAEWMDYQKGQAAKAEAAEKALANQLDPGFAPSLKGLTAKIPG